MKMKISLKTMIKMRTTKKKKMMMKQRKRRQELVQEVVDLHEDIVNNYVVEPETPDELNHNESTKKFLVQKVRKRLLDSFQSQQQWTVDADLIAMVKKCKREMSKNDD